jgi:hypothetical protein
MLRGTWVSGPRSLLFGVFFRTIGPLNLNTLPNLGLYTLSK